MRRYLFGVFAIALAIAFTGFSSFIKKEQVKHDEITVRYLQDGDWSTTNQLLSDAEDETACPDGTELICAEFYDISHLNINISGIVTGVKFMPGTMTPYPPDVVLKYDE